MNQKFPIVITHEGVNAKIHRAYQIQNGKKYPGFIVEYQEKGKRQRIRRTTLEEAKTAAQNACHKISHGSHLIIELSESAKQTYLRAIEHTMPIGVSLDVAAAEYTTAINRLPQRATLLEAIDYYCRHNSGINDTRTVQQVVAEVLKVKTDAKLSAAYLFDLDTRLSRFSEYFQMNISDVTGSMIQEWLDKLKCKGRQKSASGRSKRNYLQMVAEAFRFAITRKWLPKEAMDEIKAVQLPKEEPSEIEIYTPEEMQEVLAVTSPEMVPFVAIGAFAGMRSTEISRLHWSEIDLNERYIEVKGTNSGEAFAGLCQFLTTFLNGSRPMLIVKAVL